MNGKRTCQPASNGGINAQHRVVSAALRLRTYPGVSPLAEWVSFNFLGAALDSTKIFNGYVIRLNLELVNKNAAGVFETVSVPVRAEHDRV